MSQVNVLAVVYHPFSLWRAPSWLGSRLQSDFPQIHATQLTDYNGVEDHISEADALIGWSLRAEQFALARKLRWIHSPAAAVHQLLLVPSIAKSDVLITNAATIHGPVVAEHAIALILAMAKRLPWAMRYQQEKTWAQQLMWDTEPRPREISGATLLLIGLGNIGREVAARAVALGMRVVAVRENPARGPEGAHEVHGFDQLDALLPNADYVVLAAPLTPRTLRLFNAERLAKLRKDAYLINVARGPLLDAAALADALRRNQFAGAALDTFDEEPLPASSPLWTLPNVFITPHTAAVTEKLWERHYALIAENMRRFLSGRPLLNLVDKSRGY
jgi:phosphoglycerate dehydrogenase-like enzyme